MTLFTRQWTNEKLVVDIYVENNVLRVGCVWAYPS